MVKAIIKQNFYKEKILLSQEKRNLLTKELEELEELEELKKWEKLERKQG